MKKGTGPGTGPLTVTLLFTMSLKISGLNRSTATELNIGAGPILSSGRGAIT